MIIIIQATNLTISAKCIKWKITNFSGSTPARRLLCSKRPRKIRTNPACSQITVDWPRFCRWQLRSMFTQSRIVSSESHSIRNVSRAKISLRWTGHSRSFKVILIGVSRNTERIVVIMYNNVDIISETYENKASGKLQIRRFQPPHSSVRRVIWETLSNI